MGWIEIDLEIRAARKEAEQVSSASRAYGKEEICFE
jgi:hypothetical protein